MDKFWEWTVNAKTVKAEDGTETVEEERVLRLDGTIAAESWWDDEVSPKVFSAELNKGTGPISVWINSPGGDVFAGAQIYNLLKEYPGKVTVKIDSLAASAATVIAMAGDEVLMSPVAMFMIHNPWTLAQGDAKDFEQVIGVLEEIEESIINAYEAKTGLTRKEIAKMMDNETWMNANEALSKGFIDGILYSDSEPAQAIAKDAYSFSPSAIACSLRDKVKAKLDAQAKLDPRPQPQPQSQPQSQGRSVDECLGRLELIKQYM